MQTGAVCNFAVFFGSSGARASKDWVVRASKHLAVCASEGLGAEALAAEADVYIGAEGAFDFGRALFAIVARLRDSVIERRVAVGVLVCASSGKGGKGGGTGGGDAVIVCGMWENK